MARFGCGNELFLLKEMDEPEQRLLKFWAVTFKATHLRHVGINPRWDSGKLTYSLPPHELAKRQESVGEKAHGSLAVSLLGQVLEAVLYRSSQPRTADARASSRMGQKTVQHDEPRLVEVSRCVIRLASVPMQSTGTEQNSNLVMRFKKTEIAMRDGKSSPDPT